MPEWIFTYGSNHKAEVSLGNYYTVVEAETEGEACEKMFEVRGNKFAFSYSSREKAGVDEFNLQPAPLEFVRLEEIRYAQSQPQIRRRS